MALSASAIICVSLELMGGSLGAAFQEPAACGRLVRDAIFWLTGPLFDNLVI